MSVLKCSLHLDKRYSLSHNLRNFDKEKWNKDGHIDPDRSYLNRLLVDMEYLKLCDEKFGDALEKNNHKNYIKHPDRLIGFKDRKEYTHCPELERRSRTVRAYSKSQKSNVQEAIIQLGNHENYMCMVYEKGQEKADEIYSDYLTKAFEKWHMDNPSLAVFCATIHMDEVKDGSPHMHIDFLPVAESNRGLTTKVSLEGALKQIGFGKEKQGKYYERPYIKWLEDRRTKMEDFAQQYSNDHKLGIIIMPSEKSTGRHEQPQDWREREGRIKASDGKIAALTGKDKKKQLEAAKYIICNAQAIADSIVAQVADESKAAKEKQLLADKQIEAAIKAKKEYEEVKAATLIEKQKTSAERAKLSSEHKKLEEKEKALIKTINQQVRRRLQAEKHHREIYKTSAAQKRRYRQIGVIVNEIGLTEPAGR